MLWLPGDQEKLHYSSKPVHFVIQGLIRFYQFTMFTAVYSRNKKEVNNILTTAGYVFILKNLKNIGIVFSEDIEEGASKFTSC